MVFIRLETESMKLYMLLFIVVARAVCKPVNIPYKNLWTDKGLSKSTNANDDVDEIARTLQYGQRLSDSKVQSDASRLSSEKAHGDATKGEEIRRKRGHTQRINHFVIGHTGAISSSHNPHGVVIPVLGVSSGQPSSGPFINYGSATLTRSGPRRHSSGFTSSKHFSHGSNHHKAEIKDPETIKRLVSNGGYSASSLSGMKDMNSDVLRNLLGDGYHKNGPYSNLHGYTPGTGYYYGK